MNGLTTLDYGLVVGYLVATMLIGTWVSRYIHTGREFFLAGRTLPWWAVGVSLVATDIGGTDLIGVGGLSYRYGIAVANFEWVGCVPAMIVAAFVVIPHLWRCQVTTIPEYLERRFNVQLRLLVGACWVVFMACNLGVMLLASARLMQQLAGWTPEWTIILVSALVCFYTWSGGLAAVVYTDVLQGVVMIAGCGLVVALSLSDVGGITVLREKATQVLLDRQAAADAKALAVENSRSGGNATANATASTMTAEKRRSQIEDHFRLILPVDTPSPFPWPGVLLGLALVISPAYWMGNQAIVQRALAARSAFEAQASYVWGALLKNLIPFLIVIPGLVALVQFPNLENADLALPTLIAQTMPVGVKGVFVAAFLAAMMSSVDSYLNSATTLLANDFYRRIIRPGADERRLLVVGRWLTLGLSAWGLIFAMVLSRSNDSIYVLFQTLMSFFNGPAFGVLLLGLCTQRTSGVGAVWGFLCGVLTAVGLFTSNHPWICERFQWRPLFQVSEPFLYYALWAFLVTVATSLIVSYWTSPDSPEKRRYALGQDPSEIILPEAAR
jgi:solute:Na+ symporter, SSS family